MNSSTTTPRECATAEHIQVAAIELAETVGWEKFTVRALAEKLNYAPPILYQHFRNKDHLMQSIVEDGFKGLIDSMVRAAECEALPSRKLVAVAKMRFAFALQHHAVHSLMFGSGGPDWRREATYCGMCQGEKLVTSLLRDITGRTDDCHDLLTHFVALIKGYTYFATEMPPEAVAQKFFRQQPPESAFAQAIERFVGYIQYQPKP